MLDRMRKLGLLALAIGCSSTPRIESARRDPGELPVLVTLEGPGDHLPYFPEDGDGGVLLRLRNNTVWPVGVMSYEDAPGSSRFEMCGFGLGQAKEGVTIRPALWFRPPLEPPPEVPENINILYRDVWIAPGNSVLFTVPEKAIGKRVSVEVPVTFAWEVPCTQPPRRATSTVIPIDTLEIARLRQAWSGPDAGAIVPAPLDR